MKRRLGDSTKDAKRNCARKGIFWVLNIRRPSDLPLICRFISDMDVTFDYCRKRTRCDLLSESRVAHSTACSSTTVGLASVIRRRLRVVAARPMPPKLRKSTRQLPLGTLSSLTEGDHNASASERLTTAITTFENAECALVTLFRPGRGVPAYTHRAARILSELP